MRNFIGLIHKEENSDYGVSFPDLPGVATAGIDLDDARRMASEALALHVEGMIADGDPIPEPSSLEAIMADQANRDCVAILVSVKMPTSRSVRLNITLPEDVLNDIDSYAQTHGLTRSGFLAKAARREMENSEL